MAGGVGGGVWDGGGACVVAGAREDDCGGVSGGEPGDVAACVVVGRGGDVDAYGERVWVGDGDAVPDGVCAGG